jgi:outer membrane lipoprotein carrier protein
MRRLAKLPAALLSLTCALVACAHASTPPASQASSQSPAPTPSAPVAETYPAAESAPAPFPIPARKQAAPTPASKALKELPQVLQDLEVKYIRAVTLQADFTQINEIAALKTTKTSSGVLMVKRPDKLRWETLKPDMNLLVSDGRHFWFYTPPFDEGEHGQVIEKKSSEINSKLANALISGRFSAAGDMKIRQESPSKFLLVPKAGTAGTVSRAEIEIDPAEGLIRKVTLEHKGGNRSEITLSKIELGKKIGDDAFVFEAPPNTDKVDQ